MVTFQVSGGPVKLKLKTATSLFLCSPQGLSFLHSRIPIALERWLPMEFHIWEATFCCRHGEGRLDLEQLYAMVLPTVFKIATSKFGAALLLRLVGINISKLLNISQLRYNIVLQHSGRGWFSDFCLLSMPLPSTLRVISKTLHSTDIVSHFFNSYILVPKS